MPESIGFQAGSEVKALSDTVQVNAHRKLSAQPAEQRTARHQYCDVDG